MIEVCFFFAERVRKNLTEQARGAGRGRCGGVQEVK